MARGLFVTFEGGEGAGKSTQIKRLTKRLREAGHVVTETREPGGTPEAEAVRDLLVRGQADRWSPLAETLLNFAARDSHLREVIRPAMDAGNIVLCDRFSDSTRAYQGIAGGVDLDFINGLDKTVTGTTQPDVTLVFDIAPELGLKRAGSRPQQTEDRFEQKGLEFHRKLRQGFLQIASMHPDRCIIVDALDGIDDVECAIWKIVSSKLT